MNGRRLVTAILTAGLILVLAVPAAAVVPNTSITSGPSGLIAKRSATFRFTSNVRRATFQCKLDGAAWGSCESPRKYTNLQQGAHTFRVRARKGGAVDPTPAARSFTVDTVKPDTTILSGPSGVTDDHTPSFTFSSSEPGSFACRLRSASFEPCDSPFVPAAPLPDDSYTFEVRARDAAGNVDPTPASRPFDVETPITQTLETAEAAAALYLSDGAVMDWPASCPDWECPDGNPLPPVDQLSFDLRSRSVTEVVGTGRYDVTTTFGMTTLQPIKWTTSGVTCDVTLTPSAGTQPTWRFDMSLQFTSPQGSEELRIGAQNPTLTGVQSDDVEFSGPILCTLADAFIAAFIGSFEDSFGASLIDRVGGQLCAAPGPDYLGPCPEP